MFTSVVRDGYSVLVGRISRPFFTVQLRFQLDRKFTLQYGIFLSVVVSNGCLGFCVVNSMWL